MFSHSSLLLLYCDKTRNCSSTVGGGAECFVRARPILMDALKIIPTGMNPPSLCAATAARPMDATHPHELQSGLPPNWHGTILVFKSADNVRVVRANTQSSGRCGGDANCRIMPS